MLDTATVNCPYCGELIELVLDLSVAEQDYIEDCFVCCRPIQIHVEASDGELNHIEVRSENE